MFYVSINRLEIPKIGWSILDNRNANQGRVIFLFKFFLHARETEKKKIYSRKNIYRSR